MTKRIKDGSKWTDTPMTKHSLRNIYIKDFIDSRKLLSKDDGGWKDGITA